MSLVQRIACVALICMLSACISTERIVRGPATVGAKMQLTVDADWNHIKLPNDNLVETVWTRDGLPLDNLRMWTAIADGAPIATERPGQPALVFRSSMSVEELVTLFEAYISRGRQRFTLDKAEPTNFLGGQGTKIRFTAISQNDNVRRSGMGFMAVRNGQLHAIVFIAPALTFFPRHAAEVERMAASATLKP